MNDSNRYEGRQILTLFQEANNLLQYCVSSSLHGPFADLSHRWESGQFHWGEFQDQCFKELPKEPANEYIKRYVLCLCQR